MGEKIKGRKVSCLLCAKMIQTILAFAEVSDQNFVDDEVVEEEKESSKHNAKRIKSSTASTSSHDQVM